MYVVKRFVVCGYRFEAVATTVPPDQDGGTYPRPAPRLLGPTTKPAPLISRKATDVIAFDVAVAAAAVRRHRRGRHCCCHRRRPCCRHSAAAVATVAEHTPHT